MTEDRPTFSVEVEKFDLLELAEAAEREVRQRLYVYPGLVARGKMTRKFAQEQINKMAALGHLVRNLMQREALEATPSLFNMDPKKDPNDATDPHHGGDSLPPPGRSASH